MAPSSPPSVFVETYGCQMNVLDSELVQGQLEALGYQFVSTPEAASVVLLNTCSVRALAEQKVWSRLGRLGQAKRTRPDMVIGVLGCMAERESASILSRMPHVDVVCGPSELDRLPALLLDATQNGKRSLAVAGHTSRRSKTLERAQDGVETLDLSRAFSSDKTTFQAYVRITRGCNKFCSFCVVPFTRGPEVHRSPAAIVTEVQRLVASGVQEVTLIGQTVNHYVHAEGGRSTSFAELLYQIHHDVPDLPRLRFLTSYPRDFGDDALDAMAACPRICRFLHIPAQSGSNRLLRAMNRGYTVEDYLGLLQRARQRMPDICVAGDMIVGFPTETDDDHNASLALLRTARYKSCFVFKYSPRSGTVAARRLSDDVPDAVKKARNLALLAAQSEISRDWHERRIGQRLEVLVEGHNKQRRTFEPVPPGDAPRLGWEERRATPLSRLVGRTSGDEIVAFDGPAELVGQLVWVRARNATPLTLLAELESDGARLADRTGPPPPVALRPARETHP